MPWVRAFHSFESSIFIQFPVYITKNESAKLWISLLRTIQFYMLYTIEYRTILEDGLSRCRRIWLLPHRLLPLPCVSDREEDWEKKDNLPTEGGGERDKSYDSEKAWSSINHSLLSLSSHLTMNPNDEYSGFRYSLLDLDLAGDHMQYTPLKASVTTLLTNNHQYFQSHF